MQGEIATRVAPWWRAAERVVVLTGAGMSAESGVATFRGARHALWERFDPMQLATAEAYRADPDLVWGWYLWRMAAVRAAQPHAGHRALAELATRSATFTLVTQNVDDLHERGGSQDVLHLHGELFAHRCFDCARAYREDPLAAIDASAPQQRVAPPRCAHCGGRIRPGVVWFGESLPDRIFAQAVAAAERADLMLVIGTSGLVHPAAGLPALAQRRGARVIEINPEASAISASANLHWRATAASALADLLAALTSSG